MLRMDDKEYFIDARLCEIRNVTNPHDSEPVSFSVIEYWLDNLDEAGQFNLEDTEVRR